MSFSLRFIAASASDARKIVAQETQLPESVKAFLQQSLSAFTDAEAVSVHADGHLFSDAGSYAVSSATIKVEALAMRAPVPEPQPEPVANVAQADPQPQSEPKAEGQAEQPAQDPAPAAEAQTGA